MRRVPWQTPHTFTEDGELKLSEAGKAWFEKALRTRESLADEGKAAARVSEFNMTGTLPAKLLIAEGRQKAPGVGEFFRSKGPSAPDRWIVGEVHDQHGPEW